MTPAERAVIEAAQRHIDLASYCDGPGELIEALDALNAERAEHPTTEQDRTWGDVVATDEVLSANNGRWYTVRSAVATGDGRVAVDLAGTPKVIRPRATNPVRVRRSEMGQAVDVFASVVWSMPVVAVEPPAEPDAPGGED